MRLRTCLTALAIAGCVLAAYPASAQTDALRADLEKDWAAQKARMTALAAAMPAEKYDFKATPEQRTYGEQLLHLAEAHLRMGKTLDPAGKVPPPTLSKGHAKAEVTASLAAAYDYGSSVLKAVEGPMTEAAGNTTRARAVWAAMLNAMNHYGQCVVYLRLNGIVPPASQK